MKQTNDQSLLPVNKALKDELDRLDSLASDERELFTKEIEKSQEIQKTLESKVHDPALREKLQSLAEENHQLSNQLTPHMKAADKSQLAGKILEHKKKLESAGREVREEVAAEIAKQEIEKPLEVENDNSKLWNKILRIGAFAIGAFLVLWFIDRLSKKGVKKVRGIPDEVKEELSNELKAISRKKLSPREEVIETYNVFHDGLKTLIFTNETPPSCIVYEGISAAEPQLQRPTFTVTETFARTFYGERDVSLSELKTFRKDVRKIFSFFEITY